MPSSMLHVRHLLRIPGLGVAAGTGGREGGGSVARWAPRSLGSIVAFSLAACSGPGFKDTSAFLAVVPESITRVWVGPDFYANRLQDWQISQGRIESVEGRAAKPMRTLHLLTRVLGEKPGTVRMAVRTGPLVDGPAHPDTWSGFLVGVGGEGVDYRISALSHHWPSTNGGMIVAVDGTGRIVVRDNSVNQGISTRRAGTGPSGP